MGAGWSIAWRVHDAQFWGVPQRRRRIALVADFRGATAPEILFERESVSGDFEKSATPWKNFAAAIAKSFGGTNIGFEKVDTENAVVFSGESITSKANGSNPKVGDPCHTLGATGAGRCYCIQGNAIDRADNAGCNGRGWREDKSYTLNTIDRPAVFDARGNGNGKITPTITGDHQNRVTDYTAVAIGFPLGFRPENIRVYGGKSSTICNGSRPGFCNGVVAIDRAAFNQGENAQYDFEISESGVNSTLVAKGASAVSYSIGNGQANNLQLNTVGKALNCMHDPQAIVECGCIVRRLTPLECERLQGFPDGWTDIGEWADSKDKKRKASDAARYKALGNSIALPFWAWMLERLNGYCEEHTMASLFDGIGGFPLIWETINGKGSCLWASEIEEFPIAVTKYHFGG